MNTLLSSGGQPVLNNIRIFDFFLQHDFRRNKWGTRIKLLQETGQHLFLGISSCNPQKEMVSSDQLAAAHEKYLHHCVLLPQILAFVHGHCNNVPVLFPVGGDLLPLSNPFDAVDQVTVSSCVLKAHIL